MKSLLKPSLALLASACFFSNAVSASPIVFSGFDIGAGANAARPNSDATALQFDAAVGPHSLIDFESAPLGYFSSLVIAPGVTLTGGTLSPPNGNQRITNTLTGTPDTLYGYNTTAGGSRFANCESGTLTFTFSTPIDAFGAYFTGVQYPFGNAIGLVFNDGSSQVLPFAPADQPGGVQFLGFIDPGSQISSVTINTSGDIIAVDDVRFRASLIPEASTALLFTSGAAVLFVGWTLRRTRPRPGLGRLEENKFGTLIPALVSNQRQSTPQQ